MDRVRLDKWLWAARLYKTRSLAKKMIDGGKVHCNGHRCKPTKSAEVGDLILLTQGSDRKEIRIMAINDERRPANEAQLLYNETEDSLSKREKISLSRKLNFNAMPHPDRKPNKQERRHLIQFKHKQHFK